MEGGRLASLLMLEMSVTRPTPDHLKIFTENAPEPPRPAVDAVESLAATLKAFEQATGWALHYAAGPAPQTSDLPWSAPVNPGVGITPGHLTLEAGRSDTGRRKPAIERRAAEGLASALAGMLGELLLTQHALWKREAELAAGVPLVPAADEARHLAARLGAVLKGGAQAVGCQAAALYLLDEATSSLKLRSSWGLPPGRLTAPARPLRGAVADLEALLGSAVVLDEPAMMEHWKVPEDYPSAACVPVSTPTTILGTLWVFAAAPRTFDDHQTNILEVVAGRLAADLEREMLLQVGIEGARLKRQLAAAEQLQHDQLPSIPPQVDGWDIAGWNCQAQQLGGDFFDWFCLPDGRVATAVGDASGSPIEAALSAAGIKAALRCHGPSGAQPEQMLDQINRVLWTGSAGSQHAAIYYGLLEPDTGRLCYAAAGPIAVVLRNSSGIETLTETSSLAGQSPELDPVVRELTLQPGQFVLIASQGVVDALDGSGRALGESGLREELQRQPSLPSAKLLATLRTRLDAYHGSHAADDRTLLVVRRRDP